MRRQIVIFFALIISTLSFVISVSGQSLPTIKSTVKASNDFKKIDQVIWEKALDQYAKINSGDIDYEKISEIDKKMIDSLESGYGPLTQGQGCSWYCGGGPYKITASTYLKGDRKITYKPDNIHDFDLFTAWVPDNTNGSLGKKINFHFKPFAPRVNEILIWNGYIKNIDIWKSNSRVAKFKMFVNGKPTAILELKDIKNTQSFKINPIQSTDSTKDLILTLEILEVYKGTKYDDVAVSEIGFDGLDVHCFSAGTEITMADNTTKRIEQITKDDWVMTFDNTTNKLVKTQVSELIQTRHSNLLKLKFSNKEIITTDDHPFWTSDKNWASINPLKSNNNYDQQTEVKQLIVGDKIFAPSVNIFVDLIKVEKIGDEQMTFTLELKTGNSFIANGLLVKTEKPSNCHVACIQQEEVIVKKCFFKGMDGFPAKNYTCEKKKFKGEILLCKISYAVNGWQIIDSVSFSKEGDKNCAKSYHPIYDIQSRYIKKYELNGIDCNQVNTNLGNELPQINEQYLLSEDYLADLSFLLDKKPRENENGFQFDEGIIPSLFAQYGIPYDEQLLNFDFNVEAGLISYDSFNYLNYVLKRKFRYENNILKEVKISVERKKEGLIAEYFESFMLCK